MATRKRERLYEASVRLPLTLRMKRELEAIAAEDNTSLVEAARRCISNVLRTRAVKAATPDEHRALARSLEAAAGRVLSGQSVPLPEEYDRRPFSNEIDHCIETCERLGLDDLVIVLRTAYGTETEVPWTMDDAQYLVLVVLSKLDEPRHLEAERYGIAKDRLITAYTSWQSVSPSQTLRQRRSSGTSAEGGAMPKC